MRSGGTTIVNVIQAYSQIDRQTYTDNQTALERHADRHAQKDRRIVPQHLTSGFGRLLLEEHDAGEEWFPESTS